MTAHWTRELDEAGVVRLAEVLALKIQRGDVVALSGGPGAGRTTFARALIKAALRDKRAEIPSPAFSLRQSYSSPRITIEHFDLCRLPGEQDLEQFGFEDAVRAAAVVIERPDWAASYLPANRFDVTLEETGEATVRRVSLRGLGSASVRAGRIAEIVAFLDGQTEWAGADIAFLQGDASTRSYARLSRSGRTALLMDAPRQPDGPPIRDGKPYSQIAHLAEDMVRSFAALARPLHAAGLSAPQILGESLSNGLLLVEDLGDRLFGLEVAAGHPQGPMWKAAVDVLLRLRQAPVPRSLPLSDGTTYTLPRRDRAAFEVEIDLLLDWLWPELKGAPPSAGVRHEFRQVWQPVLDRLLGLPPGWFLRDFHSPNLIWLPDRQGVARVGVIDFQDALHEHFAFDLVSLLQDARVDVSEELERELFDYYCASVQARETAFDRAAFAAAYADFGAQRNTRLLGLWVRLLRRDRKPHYMQHMPRTWRYLERNLRHVMLAPVAAWYDKHFPAALRKQ